MKRILVFPVKNEEWILKTMLACHSLWVDHIIAAYQDSSDRTLEILESFPKVSIVENNATTHNSNVRKLLLDEARKISGEKIIFSFDADEIPTAEMLTQEFWDKVEELPHGSAIELQWIQLWRSTKEYRNDNSVWSNSWKVFGFVDDGNMEYDSLNVVNDHTSRVPTAALANIVRFDQPKILHYQFANWPRMLAKQAYYRIMEFLKSDGGFWSAFKINARYAATDDERGIKLNPVPQNWVQDYADRHVELPEVNADANNWFMSEAGKIVQQFGAAKFKWLDIWSGINIADPKKGWAKMISKICNKIILTRLWWKNFFRKA